LAERLRRLHRRGALARLGGLHDARQARLAWQQQRRSARRHHRHASARGLRSRFPHWESRFTLHKAIRAQFDGTLAIHGPFLGMEYAHRDHLIRDVVQRRLDMMFDVAVNLKASRMVLHSGYTSEIDLSQARCLFRLKTPCYRWRIVKDQGREGRGIVVHSFLFGLVGKLAMLGSGNPNWHIRKRLWHICTASIPSFCHLAQPQASQSSGIRLRLVIRNIAKWIFVYGLAPIGVGQLDREVFKRIFLASCDLSYRLSFDAARLTRR